MSGDFCFDQSWSLPLPQQPKLSTSLPCRIRPDDRFERQLYLESFFQIERNKTLGILAQAVASDDGKSVAIHRIFEKNIPTSNNDKKSLIQFCIDEVACKLYLIFRGIKQDGCDEKYFLSISSVSFGEPDRFGHRRVTLSGDARMQRINFGGIVITSSIFYPDRKTGELLFLVDTLDKKYPHVKGKLDLKGTRTIDAEILVKSKSALVMPDSSTSYQSGHMFKYCVISCVDAVILVKNLHKRTDEDPLDDKFANETKHRMLSFKSPDLLPEFHRELDGILAEYALGSKFYYAVPNQNQKTLYRLVIGDHFKDYRTCAYCGIKETHKRHNEQGKRIATFKVCRDCKKLNWHRQWWKLACHFCSDHCVKKGWKEHKKIH